MKLMCHISLAITILASSFMSNAEPFIQSSSSALNGKLMGLVLDVGEARVPAAKVIVEGKGFRQEVVSTDDGSYEVACLKVNTTSL